MLMLFNAEGGLGIFTCATVNCHRILKHSFILKDERAILIKELEIFTYLGNN